METLGIILITIAILLLFYVVVLCTQLGNDHHYILKKLNRDPITGPEGNYNGEVQDIVWIDQSLRKVQWNQAEGSWRLVK